MSELGVYLGSFTLQVRRSSVNAVADRDGRERRKKGMRLFEFLSLQETIPVERNEYCYEVCDGVRVSVKSNVVVGKDGSDFDFRLGQIDTYVAKTGPVPSSNGGGPFGATPTPLCVSCW